MTPFTPRSDSPSPPIFKLTDDALSAILELFVSDTPAKIYVNTTARRSMHIKEDKSRPLAILLCCSQTCRKWRSLITASPFLWASAVDLDILSLKSQKWVDEFVRLTGRAPLRVYSLSSRLRVNVQTPGFALEFLNEHWSRIREVKATLTGTYSQLVESICSDITEPNNFFIKQPAPLLENFSIYFAVAGQPDHVVPVPDSFPFFSGETPALRKFECHDLPGFLPPLSAEKLRHLKLSFEPAYHWCTSSQRPSIPRSNVFTTLASTPSLESLVIACNFTKDDTMENIPVIHLPRLRHLRITDETFLTAIAILDRIKPGLGCGLHLEVYPEWAATHTHLASLEAYATSFFNFHCISHLELFLTRPTLHLSAKCRCKKHKDDPAEFHLKIPAGVTFETLVSLSACNYSRITHLSVQSSFPLSTNAATETDTRIERFFALLSSVVTLQTSIYFLNEFLTRQPNTSILLPNLQHVQLATSAVGYEMVKSIQGWISHDDPNQFKDPLCQFAAHRRDIGAPLSTVDNSRYWISLSDQIVPPPTDIRRLLTQTLHRD